MGRTEREAVPVNDLGIGLVNRKLGTLPAAGYSPHARRAPMHVRCRLRSFRLFPFRQPSDLDLDDTFTANGAFRQRRLFSTADAKYMGATVGRQTWEDGARKSVFGSACKGSLSAWRLNCLLTERS